MQNLKSSPVDFIDFDLRSIFEGSRDLNNAQKLNVIHMNEDNVADDTSQLIVSNKINTECKLTRSATIADDSLMFLLTCFSTDENSNNSNNNEKEPDSNTSAALADDAIAAAPSGREPNQPQMRQQASLNFRDHDRRQNTISVNDSNHENDHVEIKFLNKTFKINTSNKRSRCVINLSDRNLTETEIDILEKGLKFCPTPGEPNMYDIHKDLRSFFRRMRLKAHFSEDPEESPPTTNRSILDFFTTNNSDGGIPEIDLSKFKPKSTWEPGDEHKDPVLETFFKCVQNDIGKYIPREPRVKNVTKSEKEAITSLGNDPNIVIKKADKGSAVVIMNTVDYIAEAERQLSDTNFYLKQPIDLTETHSQKITEYLESMLASGEIDEKIFDSIKPQQARTARFYFLPKIHKPIVKGRPIISGNNCPTEAISAFVDEHLKPFVKQVPSYVRDTTDFINKVENFHSYTDFYLVTMDVTSLYTNIPNHEGMTAVYRMMREKGYDGQVSLRSLTKLLEFVLHMNNFTFNEVNYLQCGGTAMGTRLAPSYANLFMGYLEKRLLAGAPYKPSLYLRFIDDIFLIFVGTEPQLLEFIDYMNKGHPTIKFTAEYSKEKVSFLDTWVKRTQDGGIHTELYCKPTDTHNYLHFSSCHPLHCKKGGPLGEFMRLRRNCTNVEDFLLHAEARKSDYIRRGYPRDILQQSLEKALNKNRAELLQKVKKTPKKSNRVPLVVTFNPANPNFASILGKYWPLLGLSKKCKTTFSEPPMVAYRRNKNLSDKLVRAKLPPQATNPTNRDTPIYRCINPTPFCTFCPKKDMPKQYQSSYTGRSYDGPTKYKCGTRNVIYLITCRQCKKQYIGQTYRPYRERISEHLRYVRKKKMDTATGKHFNLPGHTHFDLNHRVIAILGGTCTKNNPKLLELEEQLIERIRTMEPIGLNDKNSQRV